MRNETCSFAPGIDGFCGTGCSTGFAVAVLNAASAASRELVIRRGRSAIYTLTMKINGSKYAGIEPAAVADIASAADSIDWDQ